MPTIGLDLSLQDTIFMFVQCHMIAVRRVTLTGCKMAAHLQLA